MELNLNGKNACVAGDTRGIGLAIVKLLISEGCNVSLCARTEDAVKSTVESLNSSHAKVIGTALDATDRSAQAAWIEQSASTFGGLDIFIANVSALNTAADEEAWRQSFEADMMATVYGTEAAAPISKSLTTGQWY